MLLVNSISLSGLSCSPISIWSIICSSFSGWIYPIKDISSIYSVCKGAFSIGLIINESFSSIELSGFSKFNISNVSIFCLIHFCIVLWVLNCWSTNIVK